MDEIRVRRARVRAWRRGIREADLILGPFADSRAAALSPTELASFERLLEENDQDVYAWIVGTAPVPAEFDDDVLAQLRAHAGLSNTVIAGRQSRRPMHTGAGVAARERGQCSGGRRERGGGDE
ncbi:MAG TPA: succinate dehydrogenase assembly factor 2 [Caulobacteraceae bacterium]|jgi:antitoxin CptB